MTWGGKCTFGLKQENAFHGCFQNDRKIDRGWCYLLLYIQHWLPTSSNDEVRGKLEFARGISQLDVPGTMATNFSIILPHQFLHLRKF